MDDLDAINVAKTEIREAYNSGDIERLLFADSSQIDYPDGRRSGYGGDGKRALRPYLQDLFTNCNARGADHHRDQGDE